MMYVNHKTPLGSRLGIEARNWSNINGTAAFSGSSLWTDHIKHDCLMPFHLLFWTILPKWIYWT